MVNRIWLVLGVLSLLLVILLNVIPFFSSPQRSKYIEPGQVVGMALIYQGAPFTLNFEQQQRTLEILNRAIPVGSFEPKADDPIPDFSAIEIYRFEGDPILIEPLAWINNNLVFKAPVWSETPLMEVSRDELFDLLENAYDKNFPRR